MKISDDEEMEGVERAIFHRKAIFSKEIFLIFYVGCLCLFY